jgi:ABC-type multidrug transport system permease subunit
MAWRGHALVQLTLWRLREFWREHEAIFWTFCFPILLAASLGLAFRNQPPKILKVATIRPELAAALRQEELLDVQQVSAREAEESLRLGKIALLVVPGAGRAVVYRYDYTSPDGRAARLLADRAIQRGAGQIARVGSSDMPIVEPGSRYIDFVVPGLLGMSLLANAVWGVGYPIVDARRKKLMKRLTASPMPRHYYLMSFLFSRLLLLVLEVATLLAFGVLVFGVPLRGSWLELGALCVVASLSFLALGLLIASRVRTAEGISGLGNGVIVPMFIACGVFFSAERFPDALLLVIKALPLTAAIDALRGNMLEGTSLARLGPELGVLVAWFFGCFILAMKLFRWP